jgi:hypothetical protein
MHVSNKAVLHLAELSISLGAIGFTLRLELQN